MLFHKSPMQSAVLSASLLVGQILSVSDEIGAQS